ncbi:alpha-1,4-N-acetylglucosaminyltransferase-like [Gastrophryne carolinensis]
MQAEYRGTLKFYFGRFGTHLLHKDMRIKLKKFKIILIITALGLLVKVYLEKKSEVNDLIITIPESSSTHREIYRIKNSTYKLVSPYTIINKGNGILFVETTDRMEPPSLVLCAVESAARVYPDRPVAFFMKGLGEIITEEEEKRARKHFPTLLAYDNIYLFPLRAAELFKYTPFWPWYKNINPNKEKYWSHVFSDACRFAMMWKYGGIYMDTDVISLRPIPEDHFVAAENSKSISSSVFGLPPFHSWTWEFMENFVTEYKGSVWGYQGPGVFTRVVKKLCGEMAFKSNVDQKCANISYLHPHRFSPILYTSWELYFEVWNKPPNFSDSYALHLWNFINRKGLSMIPGSNTLVEQLYKKHCPVTYYTILRNEKIYI